MVKQTQLNNDEDLPPSSYKRTFGKTLKATIIITLVLSFCFQITGRHAVESIESEIIFTQVQPQVSLPELVEVIEAPKEIPTPIPTATPTPEPPKPTAIPQKSVIAKTTQPQGDAKTYVKSRAAAKGWTGAEWEALEFIVTKESSWNHLAVNKSSGACGLFQALPCSKMGTPWDSLEVQTNFGLSYIENRYGTPLGAKAFWDKNHWY